MAVFGLILCFFAQRRRVILHTNTVVLTGPDEYSGAHRACSVTNGRGGPVGRPDDHHALLSALGWRGVPQYNDTIFEIN